LLLCESTLQAFTHDFTDKSSSNAFIVPVVYFFYPETAYRSLEEMDTIFRKTKNIFTVVWTAKHEPHRYGKTGEILIDYEDTGEHERSKSIAERRASVASARRASRAMSRSYVSSPETEKGAREVQSENARNGA
jgi:hypothetical protein